MRDSEHWGPSVEIPLSANDDAPGTARSAVRRWLTGRALSTVVENVRLVVSELVTNSVRHSDAGAGAGVLARIRMASGTLRVEVEDWGRGGVVALRPGNFDVGGGFGLHLVEAVSQSWGVERTSAGGTRVWAVLESPPVAVGLDEPRSEHANATHAELPALAGAQDAGAERAVIDDRHQRVPDAPAPRQSLSDRAERVRRAARALGARPR